MISDSPCIGRAEQLNAGCQCVSLDHARLAAELERVSPGFHAGVMAGREHLFADSVVFVSAAHLRQMADLVAAVERVAALPAYHELALRRAPAIARHEPGTPGVFMGYDFHVGADGPRLIEINTNAGGGLLSGVLARAQRACCADVAALLPEQGTIEATYLAMFRREWAQWQARRWPLTGALGGFAQPPTGAGAEQCSAISQRRPASADLQRVAIVDEAPTRQFLYPEFVMFQRLFAAAGIEAVICAPEELSLRDGRLWHGDAAVDLVYNRLTDFALEAPAHAVLRAAYLADAALITPHPRAHALLADKRNLALLTDADLLAEWGVDAETRRLLTTLIPRTEPVDATRADEYWQRRRELFFKPAAGYGSRAAYRGDKLTRRVFDEILGGAGNDYVAQALVPPSLRQLTRNGAAVELKLDLRNYCYDGAVQLTVARLWQGQTTNFRTPGGGFATVLPVPGVASGECA